MKVTAKWDYDGRWIDFELQFEHEPSDRIRFYRSDSELFTDERDGCNGSAKWYFFTPEDEYDEDAMLFLRQWFTKSLYSTVFKTLNLTEGTVPKAPGYSFRKSDLWHFWNNVLIIVERAAMDI